MGSSTILGTLAAGVMVGASLVATTSTASASETCSLGTPVVLPSRLTVIGTSGIINRTLRVTASNCSSGDAVAQALEWYMPLGEAGGGFSELYPTRTSGTTTTFEAFQYVAVSNYFAGDLWTSIYNGGDDPVKAGPTLQLRRATRVTTNATPEPIKKGRTLTVKGKVTRANWDTGRYGAYAHHKVDLQFSPVPHGVYVKVKTVTSSASGALKTKVKAKKDGCYRYYSKQTSTAGAKASVGDCVNVK